MNITWKILKLEYIENQSGLSGIIVNVQYECIGEKIINGVTYTSTSSGLVALRDPDLNNFTPLNEVTKEQVVSWVQGVVDMFALDVHLNNSIDSQIKPVLTEIDLPFGE